MRSDWTLPRDSGFNYIFGRIDVSTKELFTAPLKNKTALETAKALAKIVDDNNLEISLIQSDNGGEFAGQFAALLKSKKIKQIFSQPSSPWTNANIERAWGTLKQMLYRYQTATGTKSWVKILLRLTENYNKTIHRSIGTSPNEALDLPTAELKKRLQRSAVQIVEPKLYDAGLLERSIFAYREMTNECTDSRSFYRRLKKQGFCYFSVIAFP